MFVIKIDCINLKTFGGQVAHSWKVVLAWICYRSRPFCGPLSLVVLCGTLGCGRISCSRFLVIIFPHSWVSWKSEFLDVHISSCLLGCSWLLWLSSMLLLVSCSTRPLLKESLNSFTLIRKGSLISNCYDWETWCHMDCQTGFISWFNRHIHNLKIINLMDNKFFWFEKKRLISIWLAAYMLQKFLCLLFIVLFFFILQALSTVLSTTSL